MGQLIVEWSNSSMVILAGRVCVSGMIQPRVNHLIIIYEINSPPSHQTLILWMNRFSSTACRPPLNPCGGRRGNKGRGSGRMMVKTGSRRKGGLWPPPFLFACFARFARKKMEGGRELVEIYFLFIKRVFCKDHDCFSSVFLIED